MSNKNNVIEKAIQDLKGRYIDNVDENFNLYLLNDVSEAGEIDQLFDKESWYLYYFEGASELHRLMNELLSFPDTYKDLLLQAIKIKRSIDEGLIKFSDDDYELIFKDLGFDKRGNSQIIINEEKIKTKDQFLTNLWTQLKNKKWVDNDIDTFLSNFLESKNHSYVNWTSSLLNLAGIMKFIIQHQFIVVPNKPIEIISEHFRIRNQPVRKRSFEVTYSKIFTEDSLDESRFQFIEDCNE